MLRVELSLDQIYLSISQHHNRLQSSFDNDTASRHSALEQTIRQGTACVSSTVARSHDQVIHRISQVSAQQVAEQDLLGRLMSRVSGIERSLASSATADTNDNEDPHCNTPREALLAPFLASNPIEITPRTDSMVSFTMTRMWKCRDKCQCACHTESTVRTPLPFRIVVGTLFMGYTGRPLIRLGCDYKTCKRHSPFRLRVTYSFPTWFLAKVIYLVAETSHMGNPSFMLTMRRRLPKHHGFSLIGKTRGGDIQGIKSLLEQRLASPNDVHALLGSTALHVSYLTASDHCPVLNLTPKC